MLPVWPAAALLQRELRTTLRGLFSFIGLVVVVAGTYMVFFMRLPTDDEMRMLSANSIYTYMSSQLIDIVTVGLLACGLVFVLPMAALSIAGERERDTFTMLHLTLIRPRGMVAAKFLNAAGFIFLVTVALMPVLGVVFFFVGVDWGELVLRLVYVGTFSVYCGAVGMWASAWSQRGMVAVMMGLGVAIAILLLMHFWWELAGAVVREISFTRYDSQAWAAWQDIRNQIGDGPMSIFAQIPPRQPLVWPSVFLVISVFFFIRAYYGVRKFQPKKIKVEAKPVDDFAKLTERRKTFPYYLIDPLKRKPPVPDGRNPMLLREIRWGALGRATRMVRIFYVGLMVQMVLGTVVLAEMPWNFSRGTGIGMMFNLALLMLITPAFTASGLTREFEVGNMDLLRTTLLKPSEIVSGKTFSALIGLSPLLLACVIGPAMLSAAILFSGGSLLYPLCGLVTTICCLALSLSAGIFASTLLKRTTQALMLSYGILIFCTFVFWVTGLLMTEYYDVRLGTDGYRALSMLSPVVSFLVMGEAHYDQEYRIEDAGPWLTSMLAYSVLAVMLYVAAMVVFARRRMRDV